VAVYSPVGGASNRPLYRVRTTREPPSPRLSTAACDAQREHTSVTTRFGSRSGGSYQRGLPPLEKPVRGRYRYLDGSEIAHPYATDSVRAWSTASGRESHLCRVVFSLTGRGFRNPYTSTSG